MIYKRISDELIWALIFICALFIIACSKESDDRTPEEDYLIFGIYYGLCMGEECIETYKLTETQLFEDRKDEIVSGNYDFELLSDDLFQRVKGLKGDIPDQLLSEESQTYGCPNCYDQGEYRVVVPTVEGLKTWRFDAVVEDNPEEYQEFINKVAESIAALKN